MCHGEGSKASEAKTFDVIIPPTAAITWDLAKILKVRVIAQMKIKRRAIITADRRAFFSNNSPKR